MKPEKQIEQKLEQLADVIGNRDSFVNDVMSRIKNSSVQPSKKMQRNIVLRRILMKKSIKYTAAAVILIAATLSLTLFDATVPTAYALEQTIEACHSVRFIHMRQINPNHEEEPVLIWAEFFGNGQPKAIRLHLPEWKNGEDGAKEIVWKNDIAEVWFKKKNGFLRIRERKMAEQILGIIKEQDPKFLVQALMDKQKRGECEIQIEHPTDKAEPILITSTNLPKKNSKFVLFVDQATQLPLKGETYTLKDGEYVLTTTGEFYDYNQPIDSVIFTFDNLPDDVIRVDQVNQQVGLVQGALTNDEAAVETARQFWQAVIEEDFDKAGQYLEGAPGDFIKKHLMEKLQAKVIEIVSVGPVQPHPNPGTGGVVVPTTLKIEKDGHIQEMNFNRLGVRQVHNQPGRWTVFGGI